MSSMSSNSTDASGPSNSDNSLSRGDIVAIAALVISMVALVATAAQVAQQYYASASGYSNCGEKVMGEWSLTKRRIFRPTELRFEVQFEAPIIFLAPPNNTHGPVEGQPVSYIDGSTASYKKIRVLPPDEVKKRQKNLSEKDRIHTADNEHATWITLLQAIQRMEDDSRQWELEEYKRKPPRNGAPNGPPAFSLHTLAVGVQSKKRSWDSMPSSVRKPYATTTMCHIIEMTAVLGLYWLEFNRHNDRYRAEGNGYIMNGSNVIDLGIMFTFQVCGKSKFKENRLIPVDEVKELCFGFVPTIFRDQTDVRRLDFPIDEARDLSTMQLGSKDGIAETLTLIGCNTNTINYFLRHENHSHLFPVAFEILGMLARTLHIKGSCFRMLPNPTGYHWDHKSFSLEGLIVSYYNCLSEEHLAQTAHLVAIQRVAEKIKDILKEKDRLEGQFTLSLQDELHSALNETDSFLKDQVPREKVFYVLRGHMQEVLGLIKSSDSALNQGDGVGESNEQEEGELNQTFGGLNSSAPENKQDLFMNIYFNVVLPAVVDQVPRKSNPNRTAFSRASTFNNLLSQPKASTGGGDTKVADDSNKASNFHNSVVVDIWCTLVFRMLCWLLLHDFHKKDAQIPKSELLGSRLPVYIS